MWATEPGRTKQAAREKKAVWSEQRTSSLGDRAGGSTQGEEGNAAWVGRGCPKGEGESRLWVEEVMRACGPRREA